MPFETRKSLTYRVDGIRAGTKEDDVKHLFRSDDRDLIEVKSLVPDVDNYDGTGELTATILFHGPPEPGPRPIVSHLEVDKEFIGLTPLNTVEGEAAADIIAITGLAGHAFGSWAIDSERMWLRDDLPKALGNRARILTYGYHSELTGANVGKSSLSDYSGKFWEDLMLTRKNPACMNRPLIFICHSLGGLVIKQCIADEDPIVLSRTHLRAIFFFGTPHGGLNIEALRTVVEEMPSHGLIAQLERGSPTLRDLNLKFRKRVTAANVMIFTYHETQPTKTVMARPEDGLLVREGPPQLMVDATSAILNFDREKVVQISGNHRTMAKIKKSRGGIFRIMVGHMHECLRSGAEMHDAQRRAALGGHNAPFDENTMPNEVIHACKDLNHATTWTGGFSPLDHADMQQERRMSGPRHSPELSHEPELLVSRLPQRRSTLSAAFVHDSTDPSPLLRHEFSQTSLEGQWSPTVESAGRMSERQDSISSSNGNFSLEYQGLSRTLTSTSPIALPEQQSESERAQLPVLGQTGLPVSQDSRSSGIGDGCDICRAFIASGETYYHCLECKDAGGNTYDICEACELRYESCQKGHNLVKIRPAPGRSCKICRGRILLAEAYFKCHQCDHFDICGDCEKKDEKCSFGHHLLKIRPGSQTHPVLLPSPPSSVAATVRTEPFAPQASDGEVNRASTEVDSHLEEDASVDDSEEQSERSLNDHAAPLTNQESGDSAEKKDVTEEQLLMKKTGPGENNELIAEDGDGNEDAVALRVTILGAGDLKKRFFSYPNPFVRASIGEDTLFETEPAGETSEPFWNKSFTLAVKATTLLNISLWDETALSKNKDGWLGDVDIEIGEAIDLVAGGDETSRNPIVKEEGGKRRGWVEIRLTTIW